MPSAETQKAEAAKREEQEKRHRDALAEQQATTERAARDRDLVLANTQRELKKYQATPTHDPQQLAAMLNQKFLAQSRLGRVMSVQFVAIPEGRLVIRWAVESDR